MFKNSLVTFIEILGSEVDLDEWYLAEFVESNIDPLSPEDAFNAASDVLDLIKNNMTSECLFELLQILLSLQRRSETIQRPLILEESPDLFNKIIHRNSQDYILNTVKELKNIWCL